MKFQSVLAMNVTLTKIFADTLRTRLSAIGDYESWSVTFFEKASIAKNLKVPTSCQEKLREKIKHYGVNLHTADA